jgi:hypothetical protein
LAIIILNFDNNVFSKKLNIIVNDLKNKKIKNILFFGNSEKTNINGFKSILDTGTKIELIKERGKYKYQLGKGDIFITNTNSKAKPLIKYKETLLDKKYSTNKNTKIYIEKVSGHLPLEINLSW